MSTPATEDVHALTTSYDAWLARQIPVVAADVTRKHAEMRADVFRFLRGGYYVWLARVATELPDLLGAVPVPLVGDLHVENFGTWRDATQVRRWGVNDLDELARGPWVLDLVRLAVSAVLSPHVALTAHQVCATLLTAYADAEPAPAVDLADPDAQHLRALVPAFASPERFYAGLADAPPAGDLPAPVVAAAEQVAEPGWTPTWHVHEAGTGSLGHRRRVGVGPAADSTPHAREAKQLGPGTARWATGRAHGLPVPEEGLYAAVEDAVRGPAGATRVADWQVRDLAPDVVRIELAGLHRKDADRLLVSMAAATAGVHAVDPDAARAARGAARTWTADRLHEAVHTMVASTKADHAAYRDR